ncbi:MAG: MFS transporter [Lachnospiraceae bacterium]
MNNTTKTRIHLYIGSALTILLVSGFLVLLNINTPIEYTRNSYSVLLILTIIACAALVLFYARGPVFDVDGKLEALNINAMLIMLLVLIQIAFFFGIISTRDQILSNQVYNNIRNDITTAQDADVSELNDTLRRFVNDSITEIDVINASNTVLYSSDPDRISTKIERSRYTYVYDEAFDICFHVDWSFIGKRLWLIVMNMLTVVVTSIFFAVEMVFLMIRVVSKGMEKQQLAVIAVDSDAYEEESAPAVQGMAGRKASSGARVTDSLYYIRQIAFLFYFASRLSSTFIPIMARSLYNPFGALSDTTAAGLPQSAETLLTCSAIFITTLILEKKGWKLPFVFGLVMVAAGTLFSGLSPNLVAYILSRALVGLGYGFCWMTLRNISLFGRTEKDQILGFALLNAGIYSGINCGAAIGAILADILGFRKVFFISAGLTLLTSFFIIRMENALLPRRVKEKNVPKEAAADSAKTGEAADNAKAAATAAAESSAGSRVAGLQIATAALFVILMIAPICITDSFMSYYLPLYFEHTGKSVTDVGRAQLLYGLVIVYAGPALSVLILKFRGKSLKNLNVLYNLMVAVSLFLPGLGAGLMLPFLSAALLGTADSFGFGVQNNFFLDLPAVSKMERSVSLSLLSFIKKLLEMTGPMAFAAVIMIGYQRGIMILAVTFAIMAIVFMILSSIMNRSKQPA